MKIAKVKQTFKIKRNGLFQFKDLYELELNDRTLYSNAIIAVNKRFVDITGSTVKNKVTLKTKPLILDFENLDCTQFSKLEKTEETHKDFVKVKIGKIESYIASYVFNEFTNKSLVEFTFWQKSRLKPIYFAFNGEVVGFFMPCLISQKFLKEIELKKAEGA
jgi:hypothetical protein